MISDLFLQAFCDRRRGSKVFNHLMTVKEGIGCVGWVTVVSQRGMWPGGMACYGHSLLLHAVGGASGGHPRSILSTSSSPCQP